MGFCKPSCYKLWNLETAQILAKGLILRPLKATKQDFCVCVGALFPFPGVLLAVTKGSAGLQVSPPPPLEEEKGLQISVVHFLKVKAQVSKLGSCGEGLDLNLV